MTCFNCPHKKTVRNRFNQPFEVCKNECGEFVTNSGHPLSPCELGNCLWFDEDGHEVDVRDLDSDEVDEYLALIPECEVDEIAILEGNRCTTYIAWLSFMRRWKEGEIREAD